MFLIAYTLLLLCISVFSHLSEQIFHSDEELYLNAIPANTTECLHKVLLLPIKLYEYKYDSIAGRRQIGVFGTELQDIFPESVEIKPRTTTMYEGEVIQMENFAVVDRNVIFMHNVGAVQELAVLQSALSSKLDSMTHKDEKIHNFVAQLQRGMSQEMEMQIVERSHLLEAEIANEKLNRELKQIEFLEKQLQIEIEAEKTQNIMEQTEKIQRLKTEQDAQNNIATEIEKLRLQEESERKKEELRLETEKALQQARLERAKEFERERIAIEMELIKSEIDEKSKAERANEDIELRKLHAQAEEDKKQIIEAIHGIFGHLSVAVISLLSDPKKSVAIILWFLALSMGYFILREGVMLAARLISSRLGQPSLIRETSKKWNFRTSFKADKTRRLIEERFADVILPSFLKEQVLSLATSTRNARKNMAPFRHLLLFGPPGTGKTMVAKKLAESTGLEYAFMSGGDIGPLGKTAVTELHKIFNWAKRSRKGLLLFIDEAEAFLGSRTTANLSEDARNALNALLYQTGTFSYNFMLVLATNRAEDLDEAVVDRMDDSLLFPLPEIDARKKLLSHYYNAIICTQIEPEKNVTYFKDLLRWKKKFSISVDKEASEEYVVSFADQIEGFSGREISKLLLSLLNSVFGVGNGANLTTALIDRVFKAKIEEHTRKLKMKKGLATFD